MEKPQKLRIMCSNRVFSFFLENNIKIIIKTFILPNKEYYIKLKKTPTNFKLWKKFMRKPALTFEAIQWCKWSSQSAQASSASELRPRLCRSKRPVPSGGIYRVGWWWLWFCEVLTIFGAMKDAIRERYFRSAIFH